MRIRLSDLPSAGLPVSDEISLANLNARLNDGKPSDIEFLSPPKVTLMVIPNSQGAEAKGRVQTTYRQDCGRCLEPIQRDLDIALNFVLKERPEYDQSANPADALIDDVGIVYFEGEHLDLEPTIQECLLLALSLYWSPEIDPSGRCLGCKKEISPEPIRIGSVGNLGELLKEAAQKKRK